VSRPVDWVGRLDHYAQSVDQRVKMAGWMETFAERGGRLVIHGAAVSDLDYFSRAYDLVLVAAGKGELVSMFGRDASRSPYDTPQRALAAAYVHGVVPRPEYPDARAVHFNIVPGVGELFVSPALTMSGPADILFWEGLPGGPVDVFDGVRDPREHLAVTLDLIRRFLPWEYDRVRGAELTDAGGTLSGRYAPVVRDPIGVLPSGGLVLGVADVIVANDPLTGQGSNNASRCATSYLASILDHGDRPFDRAWMRSAFERYWDSARHVTRWTNLLLGPPPQHVLDIMAAAGRIPAVARRFVNGFDDPSDFGDYFFEPDRTAAYLAAAATQG
jgi:hypothetical protein